MRITKFLHSCILIETASAGVLFDPGKFSFVEGLVKPEQFRDLTAILLTHFHPDHVEPGALQQILEQNPHAQLLTNTQAARELASYSISSAIIFEDGERSIKTSGSDLHLRAIPAQHAPILGSEPPQNTAYVLDDTLLNPGDSFAPALDACIGTPVLLLPVMAPWEKELEMFDFAKRMKPQAVIPVHDGQAKPFFLDQRYATFDQQFQKIGITFANLKQPGDTFTYTPK